MATAYILINSNLGTEESVAEKIKEIADVKEVFETKGAYDIVAKLEAESNRALRNTITKKIRMMQNIRSILTLADTKNFGKIYN